MPAQLIVFIFYFALSVFVFPFAAINILIANTNILPNLKAFVIKTASMEPVIPKDSLIYTLGSNHYKKGEIIAFQQNGNVTHRIVEEEVLGSTTYYSTKGDANEQSDEDLVPISSIYGRVIAIIPFSAILTGAVLPTLFLLFIPLLVFVKVKE